MLFNCAIAILGASQEVANLFDARQSFQLASDCELCCACSPRLHSGLDGIRRCSESGLVLMGESVIARLLS